MESGNSPASTIPDGFKVVGFYGPVRSGKSYIAELVARECGYVVKDTSAVLHKLCAEFTPLLKTEFIGEASKETRRATYKRLAQISIGVFGPDILCRTLVWESLEEGASGLCIAGVRMNADVEYIRSLGGVLCRVLATEDTIKRRYEERLKEPFDPKVLQEPWDRQLEHVEFDLTIRNNDDKIETESDLTKLFAYLCP